MAQFCINPLAAMEQCQSPEDVQFVISNLVDCFEYLLPTIKNGAHTLIFDPRLEQRFLRRNENFNASINSLQSGADIGKSVKRLWFSYTKNRSIQADWEPSVDATVTATGATLTMAGDISKRLMDVDVVWLSIGGTDIGKSPKLTLTTGGGDTTSINNFHDLDSLQTFLPVYEKSDKHRRMPYIDTSGDYVSAMTLPDILAQGVLLIAVQDDDDRIGYHEQNDKYYRFKITRLNIYHGFEVDRQDLSPRVLALLHPKE